MINDKFDVKKDAKKSKEIINTFVKGKQKI